MMHRRRRMSRLVRHQSRDHQSKAKKRFGETNQSGHGEEVRVAALVKEGVDPVLEKALEVVEAEEGAGLMTFSGHKRGQM